MKGLLRAKIDVHICNQFEGTVPHVGGPGGLPMPPAVSNVLVNGEVVITVGDSAFCVGRADKVVTGITTVLAGGRPVGDFTAATEHGGHFLTASTDVMAG